MDMYYTIPYYLYISAMKAMESRFFDVSGQTVLQSYQRDPVIHQLLVRMRAVEKFKRIVDACRNNKGFIRPSS